MHQYTKITAAVVAVEKVPNHPDLVFLGPLP